MVELTPDVIAETRLNDGAPTGHQVLPLKRALFTT